MVLLNSHVQSHATDSRHVSLKWVGDVVSTSFKPRVVPIADILHERHHLVANGAVSSSPHASDAREWQHPPHHNEFLTTFHSFSRGRGATGTATMTTCRTEATSSSSPMHFNISSIEEGCHSSCTVSPKSTSLGKSISSQRTHGDVSANSQEAGE